MSALQHSTLPDAWLLGAIIGLSLSLSPSPSPPPTPSNTSAPPNILFCIADDWGWPHAASYGDTTVRTPAFDRIAREGVLFEHAFVSSPSCTPSRNAILTGQFHWRLGAGANLWSWLDIKHPVYPLLLEKAGYHVGHWRKSWGPGKLELGGYETSHPAGENYKRGLRQFLEQRPEDAPFCFWLGSSDPHRGYDLGSGRASGMNIDDIRVPAFYPDTEQVRSDIADYYFEVQRFDRDVADAISLLEELDELENTIVVVTGDHGMPFPRCKSNIYEMGVRVPLAIRWGRNTAHPGPEALQGAFEGFVSLTDIAPTFLAAAGVEIPEVMNGRDLAALLRGDASERPRPDFVIYGMERHTAGRPGGVGYPCRGLRTERWAYIRNYEPERWPAGDPPNYADCDPANGPGKQTTKTWILDNSDTEEGRRVYDLCFAKRPAEELYDLQADPHQLKNVAAQPALADTLNELRTRLQTELEATADPRASGKGEAFEKFPYFGGGVWKEPKK